MTRLTRTSRTMTVAGAEEDPHSRVVAVAAG